MVDCLNEVLYDMIDHYFRKTTCGSSVAENCTYIQNPGYSSSYTTSGSCSYSVTPLNTGGCGYKSMP